MPPDTMQRKYTAVPSKCLAKTKKQKMSLNPVKPVELSNSLQEMQGNKLSNTPYKQLIQNVGHSTGPLTWFSQQNNGMEEGEV